MLDSPKDFHYKIDKVDIVMSTKTNIEELLLSFDLPINQVAIDKDDDFIISYECLKAIYSGIYYLLKYLQNMTYYSNEIKGDSKIMDLINKESLTVGPRIGEAYKRSIIDVKFKKHHNRVLKYEKRGFRPIYVGDKGEHIMFTPEYYKMKGNY